MERGIAGDATEQGIRNRKKTVADRDVWMQNLKDFGL